MSANHQNKNGSKIKWMTPKEVAGHFGLKEDSAYRWIDEGTIPDRFLRHQGTHRIVIKPEAVPYLEKLFTESRMRQPRRKGGGK